MNGQNSARFNISEVPKVVKFTETESRMTALKG